MPATSRIPAPDLATARQAARTFARDRHVLGALEAVHDVLGDLFRLPLPGFDSVVAVGPEANKFILTESREHFLWRAESDPVTRLLRQGLLVTDGAFHDELRQAMTPALHRSLFEHFTEVMWRTTDRITSTWREGEQVDLLVEMRRIALCILTDALFADDFGKHLDVLWHDILRTIRFISPGPWLLWPGIPRPGYRQAIQRMDTYCYRLIASRRARPESGSDLLSRLIDAGMSDGLIRDQLLTMFIAGHDTSTALLAWAFYLLLTHPESMDRAQAEIDAVIGGETPDNERIRQLRYLDCVIKETLRLYPPIHLGSRIAATDMIMCGFPIPAGTRVLYSIYLTHRDKKHWPSPDVFDPARFSPENIRRQSAYTYLPFGAGPRNCLGAAFAQVEARVVLARILQRFALTYAGGRVRPHMQATLEPSPGVVVTVRRRSKPALPDEDIYEARTGH